MDHETEAYLARLGIDDVQSYSLQCLGQRDVNAARYRYGIPDGGMPGVGEDEEVFAPEQERMDALRAWAEAAARDRVAHRRIFKDPRGALLGRLWPPNIGDIQDDGVRGLALAPNDPRLPPPDPELPPLPSLRHRLPE